MPMRLLHRHYPVPVLSMRMTDHRPVRLLSQLQSVLVDQLISQLVSYQMRQQLLR